MSKVNETPEDESVPPECRLTCACIQNVLDGTIEPEALDADPHPTACSVCRERVRAARVLLSVLAAPSEPVVVPADFSERVVKAMREDRHARTRGGVYKTAAGLALAAAVLVAIFTIANPPPRDGVQPRPRVGVSEDTAKAPEIAPAPREKTPAPAPEPRPIRFTEAVANTGQALRDTPRPFAESVAVAPKVFEVLTGPFKLPAPPPDPMGTALAPARKSLSEIPVAARAGLEPVTGTAEKAFTRFLRDLGSVKPNS